MNLTTHVILWCVTSWCRGVRHAHLFTLLQCTIKMSMPGLCKHAFHHQTCVPSSNTHFIIKHAFYHQACSPSSSMHSIGKHVLHHQTCISSLPRLRAERETDRENYDAWASQQVWSYIGWPLSASMYDQTRQLAQALYFSVSLSFSLSPDPKIIFGGQQDSSKQTAKLACDLCMTPYFGSQRIACCRCTQQWRSCGRSCLWFHSLWEIVWLGVLMRACVACELRIKDFGPKTEP